MSFHRIKLLAATALVLLGPAGTVPAPHTEAAIAPTDAAFAEQTAARTHATATLPFGVTVPESLTVPERDAARWAVGQFEAAGLELPAVAISFSSHAADCEGEQGVYRLDAGEHSIVVCVPDLAGAAIDHRRKRTLLHELAHAWDHATLTETGRRSLQLRFGADDWYAPGRPWGERPVEQLAETLTWGLLGQRRRPLLVDRPCDQVHADFRAVTGMDPLGPIEPVCEIGDADQTVPSRQLRDTPMRTILVPTPPPEFAGE